MKLSLAWIFDHIDADWKNYNIDEIVTRFNAVTAEIEGIHPYVAELENIAFARIESKESDRCQILIPEWNKEYDLPNREDAQEKQFFMVKKEKQRITWATLADFKLDKLGFMPAFDITLDQAKGSWRKLFEAEDIIIDVDNKSITHRPDMWGHRGFAREIAAFMDLSFKDSSQFLSEHTTRQFDKISESTPKNPFIIDNQAPKECARFCGLYLPSIKQRPSSLLITSRLIKVGSRPVNGIIDITNYVMLDWSQPVHAYDASRITNQKILIRHAKEKESLTLLGDIELPLTNHDLVIADSTKPLCLAGVKGGKYDSILPSTTSIFFEAANFDAATVRRTAFRHKTRTESSARFEKTLNIHQTVEATFRFKKLLADCNIEASFSDEIIVIGNTPQSTTITLNHHFLESRSGIRLGHEEVVNSLTKLGFTVNEQSKGNDYIYKVKVPPYRASKDIKTKEDILEEVVRSYGFEKIPLHLPHIYRKPFDTTSLTRLRKIKQYWAYSAHMTEQQNYSLYDEAFLAEHNLNLTCPIAILNPVSENMHRLISSLVPGLLKNVQENHVQKELSSFFECGRVWQGTTEEVKELKALAGIAVSKTVSLNFYDYKQHLISLFNLLNLDTDTLIWQQEQVAPASWYTPYQTASIHHQGLPIGHLGKIDNILLNQLGLPNAHGYIFEVNLEHLLSTPYKKLTMQPLSKFQDTYFDISLLVPLRVTTASLHTLFEQTDAIVTKTELVDFFEREEWDDVRSLTFRFWLNHKERTLEKDEIENVRASIITVAQAHGATLRAV